MIKIRKRFGNLLPRPDQWKKIIKATTPIKAAAPFSPVSDHLTETANFGPNPGALRMFSHLPAEFAGCTQSAAGYDFEAGWSTLADRFGFALLLPEQQRSNNPNGCFNWFQSENIERGHGEAASIRQMVATMVSDHGIDPARVFVTGLGGRRDDFCHARHLSGSVRRRRNHRRTSVRGGSQHAAGFRDYVSMPAARSPRMG